MDALLEKLAMDRHNLVNRLMTTLSSTPDSATVGVLQREITKIDGLLEKFVPAQGEGR